MPSSWRGWRPSTRELLPPDRAPRLGAAAGPEPGPYAQRAGTGRKMLVDFDGLVASAAEAAQLQLRGIPGEGVGGRAAGTEAGESEPLLKQITQMNRTLAAMDKQIEGLAKKYPEITLLRTAPGCRPVVAACYVLTLGDPETMETNRQAGAYLGLRPRQQQSGNCDQQCRIASGQQLPAQFAGAVGAIHPGRWPRLGVALLGPQACRPGRQARQEAHRHRRRSSQAGRALA